MLLADEVDDSRSESILSLSQHGVSFETIQKIEKKHKLEGEARNRNNHILERQEHLMDVEQHLKLAEGIRSLFTANSGKPLMVDKVLSQLADKTRGVFTSPSEMKQLIQKLA